MRETGPSNRPSEAEARCKIAISTLQLLGAAVRVEGGLLLAARYWPEYRSFHSDRLAATALQGSEQGADWLDVHEIEFHANYCKPLNHDHPFAETTHCVHIVRALGTLVTADYQFRPLDTTKEVFIHDPVGPTSSV